MSTDDTTDDRSELTRSRLAGRQPLAFGNPWRVLSVVLALGLALACGPAIAAKTTKPTNPKLVTPASTGEAKTARQALLKQRNLTVSRTTPHPGKIVGATTRPPPKTIVTKRFLPK
jgi:hypothetical protein